LPRDTSTRTRHPLKEGDRVHLERALALGDRLGGHLVTGHIDGVGALVSRASEGDYVRASFEVPQRLAPFLAPKGSITVNGVSLTVNTVAGTRFDVMLVPFTLDETTFGDRTAPGLTSRWTFSPSTSPA
jgi:riboflavin synthase